VDSLGGARRRRLTEHQNADARVALVIAPGVGKLQQIRLEVRQHREEGVDHHGVEVPPALGLELRDRVVHRPAPLVGAVGAQGVEDVADRGDARGERDRLAREAGGVAGAVEALVVRERDLLRELQQR